MSTDVEKPPPVINSARTILSAVNDDSVTFTGRINLFVGNADNLEKLGEMPLLAICENYCSPGEIFLFFCDNEWEPQGTVVLASVEEAKTKAEIISKISIVEEEADETLFWLEIINEINVFHYEKLDALMKENNEILAIVVASIKTAKRSKNKS